MKPLFLAAASALGGAAFAAALFVAFPSLTKDADDEAAKAPVAAAAPEGVVMLDKAQATRAGIHIVTLASAQAGAIRQGFARALDISALSAIQGEIASARAALSASQADYARQRALAADGQSASTQAVESARAQALADQVRLATAIRRVGLEYGSGLARLSDAALGDLIRAIAAGRASLVRIDFPDGAAPDGSSVQVGAASVRLLGPAAAADAHLQSAGSLAIVQGPVARDLSAGRVLPASMVAASGTESGVMVPRDALLRYQGGLWVYRVEQGGYRRVELTDARAQGDGWFAGAGVKPGDRVAVGGPAVLLFMERGGEPKSEDD